MLQQAQPQAQISALQQQNALLDQQLATQAAFHIHQLQKFIHQPTPRVQSPPLTPIIPPSSPEPPQPKAPPEGTSTTSTSFNPEEMIEKLRDNFKEEMADTFRKFQESNQPQPPTSPTPPPPVIPPQPPHPPLVAPQSSHVHASPVPHRRSRSPLPTRDHLREDKTFRLDNRSIPQPRSPHRRCGNIQLIPGTDTDKPHAH